MVVICGIRVYPGDLVIADDTGVCFVPRADAPARALSSWVTIDRCLWLLVAVAVCSIVIAPRGVSIDSAFRRETRFGLSDRHSLNAFINVYTSGEYLQARWQTVLLAGTVTVFSIIAGVAIAILVAFQYADWSSGMASVRTALAGVTDNRAVAKEPWSPHPADYNVSFERWAKEYDSAQDLWIKILNANR